MSRRADERCEISIIIPWPERPLWPNRQGMGRREGFAKARARKKARMDGKILGLSKRCTFERPIISALFVHPKRGGVPDADNCLAAIKGYVDGLTDAGLWKNDRIVEWGSLRRERAVTSGGQRVELTIKESRVDEG